MESKYFSKGKINELRANLSPDIKESKKKSTLKRIVANMTLGNDMSPLFPQVVSVLGSTSNLEIKKMIYLFLVFYAKSRHEQTELIVSSFSIDIANSNPFIAATALRNMTYINVGTVLGRARDLLGQCLKDKNPYVAKTAAIATLKLFVHDRSLINAGDMALLTDLLRNPNSTVVSNAVAVLHEIDMRTTDGSFEFSVDLALANTLMTALDECAEWGQVYILEAVTKYVPQESIDAELLVDRILPRLQHANAAVALTAVKSILYFLNYISNEDLVQAHLKKIVPPLVTLLHHSPEVQYVTLENINLLVQMRPSLFVNDLRSFFCRYNDPIYIKLSKLKVMYRLTREESIGQVLDELKEYANEVDVDFVRSCVRIIGRLAIKFSAFVDQCTNVLVELVKNKVNYVVQEAIVVVKDIFRKYPDRYESLISLFTANLEMLTDPEAKSSMIWIVGQYSDRIENANQLLSSFLATFDELSADSQVTLLVACTKMFLKSPDAGHQLYLDASRLCMESQNPDVRDRGYMYWRMMSLDPVAAKKVILFRSDLSVDDVIDERIWKEFLLEFGSLSTVVGKPLHELFGNVKAKQLVRSPAFVGRDWREKTENIRSVASTQPQKETTETLFPSMQPQSPRKKPQPTEDLLLDLDDEVDQIAQRIAGVKTSSSTAGEYQSNPINSGYHPMDSAPPISPLNQPSINQQVESEYNPFAAKFFQAPNSPTHSLYSNVPLIQNPGVTIDPFARKAADISRSASPLVHLTSTNEVDMSGQWIRFGSSLFFSMSVSNKTMGPMSGFKLLFNKNGFGLVAGEVNSLSVLSPMQTMTLECPVQTTDQIHVNNPLNRISCFVAYQVVQIALKATNLSSILYFSSLVPLFVLFEEYSIDQEKWLGLWKHEIPNQATIQFSALHRNGLGSRLESFMVHVVAERTFGTAIHYYTSAKMTNRVLFLSEIRFEAGLCLVTTKTFAMSAVDLFHESLKYIICE